MPMTFFKAMESAEKRAQAATNILRLMVNCKCPKCKPSSRSEHSFQVRITTNFIFELRK